MAAFDATFDAAFDAGPGTPSGPALIGTSTAAFGLAVSIVNPLVFASGEHAISWYATVVVGTLDISARLTGLLHISGAEGGARIATLSVIPADSSEAAGYDSRPVTIDVTLFRPGQMATYRRFTGVVEKVDYDAAGQVVTLSLRDGYQERPKACKTAAAVEALFAGQAYPSPALLAWNTAQPDPAGYFAGLLDTFSGSCQIDSSGIWQATPWAIGTARAAFSAADIFDGSFVVKQASRADLPVSISASLTHRYPRLHAALVNLSWDAVERERYVVDGLPTAPKSMIAQAVASASGWYVKGQLAIVQPTPGTYPVIVGSQTVPYLVSIEQAQTTCESFSAQLYRRWYQEIDVVYRVTIPLGGSSEREASIAGSIQSTFDASAWESAPSAESSNALYLANAPTSPVVKTGYEGLPEPWPVANTALDHYADLSAGDIAAACRNVVGRAVRRAAQGQRQSTVAFDRPLDPRWEIGDVLAVSAYGVTATGQLTSFDDQLDHDSGAAISRLTLACPAGGAASTGFVLTPTTPTQSVAHALLVTPLGNHVGAHYDTPAVPDEATLSGFLCNCLPTSDNYDSTKPVYVTQFRILLPEIAAAVRDPLTVEHAMGVTVSLAGSGIAMDF